tara:strand:+ start:1133 stop:1330 length:198 start_codon:yes stop_codon:yes gene_type:complete
MVTTVFDVLISKITEHKVSAEEFLSSGGPSDYAGYRETCGVIRGYEVALREVHNLSRNYMDDDDE